MITNREKAQKIYDEATPTREQYVKMGMDLSGILALSVEEIEAHLNLVDDVNAQYGTHIDPSKVKLGVSRDELEATAKHRRSQSNGRKGVNALVNKYGHDSAARIVKKYSGKTIR